MPVTLNGRARIFRRGVVAIMLLLTTVSYTGCTPILLLGYLIGGPPTKEPKFHEVTKKSMDARNTTVLVYCYAPNDLKYDQDKVDYEVAKTVALRLNAEGIKVVDPDRVYAWLDSNPDFEREVELGAAFNATYLIKIDLHDYSLFAERSHDLYQGRCNGHISVWEMDMKSDGKTAKKSGKIIFSTDVASRYPKEMPVQSSQCTSEYFKKLFLSALSAEIGGLFYPTLVGEEFTRTAAQ